MRSVEEAVSSHHAKLITAPSVLRIDGEPMGYQYRNWLLAKCAVAQRLQLDGMAVPNELAFQRAAQYIIPGRFEVFQTDDELIILDAAHNPQKMKAFIDTLKQSYSEKFIIAVVSLGRNKESTAEDTLSILAQGVDEVVATEFRINEDDTHNALDATQLTYLLKKGNKSIVIRNTRDALIYARKKAKHTGGITVVTGSFYLVSNLRGELISEFNEE